MDNSRLRNFLNKVLENMPEDWLNLTTHRLDIYEEPLAKVQFLEQFELLFNRDDASSTALAGLPTAYDYIRLGHPLSCILEWAVAKSHGLDAENVIAFSSRIMPALAVVRENTLNGRSSRIILENEVYGSLPGVDFKSVYGYDFVVETVEGRTTPGAYEGTTIYVSQQTSVTPETAPSGVDFYVAVLEGYGAIMMVGEEQDKSYVGAIQHVRRRETIAMTPHHCRVLLHNLVNDLPAVKQVSGFNRFYNNDRLEVNAAIRSITGARTTPVLGSSGLSVQYAILMGLIEKMQDYISPDSKIKILVPTNCYGGTNDQARRLSACLEQVEVVDLDVDGEKDMVEEIDALLESIAQEGNLPIIIAEIPTNPRLEIPDLMKLKEVLARTRYTQSDGQAYQPIFIIDQTLCPDFHFLGQSGIYENTIVYASGSKFPSGGRCTAGYCVVSENLKWLAGTIENHLLACDNGATEFQIHVLATEMSNISKRIQEAYYVTREFVANIESILPAAKVNFITNEMAEWGFQPSVFSLDLPTKGDTHAEREAYKRKLNQKLIDIMIEENPGECKYCVSYGQLKGSYWTIPATSTQGTTQEGHKDYIVRVAMSPEVNMWKHVSAFNRFVYENELHLVPPLK